MYSLRQGRHQRKKQTLHTVRGPRQRTAPVNGADIDELVRAKFLPGDRSHCGLYIKQVACFLPSLHREILSILVEARVGLG